MAAVPASEICFLADLPAKAPGHKVRFLGCVTAYDTAAGILTLQHQYQPSSPPPPPSSSSSSRHVPVRARVNVDLVLERLTAELTSVGAWVNVLAYVTEAATVVERSRGDVSVQALLLWPTGPLDLQVYERQLSAMLGRGTAP